VILVDSDVLIAHLRGYDAARAWLRDTRRTVGALSISAVSITEISGGMRTHERREVWRLLNSFRLEPVTEIVARRAGEFMRTYRRSHGSIDLGDYLIAATADIAGLSLSTLDVRHFPMFEGLERAFALR
jgi:predicted nucleic acid-binding protein